MTYLFTNNQEIKNDVGNPIPVSKDTNTNSASNPIHVSISSANMPEVEIKNDLNNPIPISKDTNTNSASNPIHVSISAANMPEVEIKNDLNNPIPISKNTQLNSESNPISVTGTVSFPTGSTDAFGRTRVTEPYTLGDYKSIYGEDPNFIDHTENGGTAVHQANKACVRMTTSSNTASRVVHQTKLYHHYLPGKSQLILSSVNFYAPTANVTKRTGYFDDRNGIFFEQAGDGTLSFNIRSYVSGAVVDTKISKNGGVYGSDDTGWNGDKVAWLDMSKTQLVWIDFQWLGVGKVRVGFVHENEYVVCHTFYNSNNLPTVYMSMPSLPVRCEIKNTGTTTGAYMDQICSSVMSEGGYTESGTDWSIASPTLRSVSGGATLPVLAIRLKNSYHGYLNRMFARLQNISVFTDTQNVSFKIVKLTDSSQITTSAAWVSADDNSGIEYNTGATAVGSIDIMISGYVVGGTATGSSSSTQIATTTNARKNFITQNFDSTDSEIYAVLITNMSSNQATNCGVALQWREVY